jgi:hypothetical protein
MQGCQALGFPRKRRGDTEDGQRPARVSCRMGYEGLWLSTFKVKHVPADVLNLTNSSIRQGINCVLPRTAQHAGSLQRGFCSALTNQVNLPDDETCPHSAVATVSARPQRIFALSTNTVSWTVRKNIPGVRGPWGREIIRPTPKLSTGSRAFLESWSFPSRQHAKLFV